MGFGFHADMLQKLAQLSPIGAERDDAHLACTNWEKLRK